MTSDRSTAQCQSNGRCSSTPAPTPIETPVPTPAPCWQSASSESLGNSAVVHAISKVDDLILAGGAFGNFFEEAYMLATYEPSLNTWKLISSENSGTILSIAVVSLSEIYVGGQGLRVQKVDISGPIAVWSEILDSSTATLSINVIYALVISNNKLYVGGDFAGTLAPSGSYVSFIMSYDLISHTWESVGLGFNWLVLSLATDGTNIYAGGTFDLLGDSTTPMKYISKWDGFSWTAMGSASETNGGVTAMVWSPISNILFVTGQFTTIGGYAANYIAGWNGDAWFSLGSGLSDYGIAISTLDGLSVFVTGFLTTAGGNTAYFVAQWNGVNWFSLEQGLNNAGRAILAAGVSTVYVGGQFSAVGNSLPANAFAKFICSQASVPTPVPTPMPTPNQID